MGLSDDLLTVQPLIQLNELVRKQPAERVEPETYRDLVPDPVLPATPSLMTSEDIKAWLAEHIHQMDAPYAYIGDEPNTFHKDWADHDFRTVIVGGMSYNSSEGNLAVPLIYSQLNHTRPQYITERAFFPNTRKEWKMFRDVGVPIFSLENKRPFKDFDVIGFSISYIMPFLHVFPMLHYSGIAGYALDRKQDDPIVMVGGCMSFVCEILGGGRGGVYDLAFIGESEDGLEELLDEIRDQRARGVPRREMLLDLQRRYGDRGVYVPQFYDVEYDKETHAIVRRVKLEAGIPDRVRKAYAKNLNEGFLLKDPFISYAGGMAMGHLEIARGCSSGCVSGDTWVNTTRGLSRVKHLVSGPFVELCAHGQRGYMLDTSVAHDKGSNRAGHLFEKGSQQTLVIKTELGVELTLTPDHMIRIIDCGGNYADRVAGEILEGDVLPISLGGWLGSSTSISIEDLWLMGYMIGDGHVNEKGEVWLFSSSRLLDEKIAKIAYRLLGKPDSKGWHSQSDKVYQWRWSHKTDELAELWDWNPSWRSHTKEVPPCVLYQSEDGVKSFLTGLFEADGTNDQNECKRLSTTSEVLADQVQQLLLGLGVVASRQGPYKNHKGSKLRGDAVPGKDRYIVTVLGGVPQPWEMELLSEGKGKRTPSRTGHYKNQSKLLAAIYDRLVVEGKQPYRVHLRKEGELTYRKAELALAMLDDCPERTQLSKLVSRNQYHTTVKSIEYGGSVEVFDIAVHDYHWFNANSVTVHNCNFCQEGFNYRPYRERSSEVVVPAMKELMENVGSIDVVPASFTSSDHHQIDEIIKRLLEEVTDKVNIISQRADAFGLDPSFAWLTGMGGSKTVSVGMEGISQRMRDVMSKAINEENLLKTVEFALRAGYKSIKFFMITNVPGTTDSDYEELIEFLDKVAVLKDKYNPRCEIKLSFTPLFLSAFTPFQWHKVTVDERSLTPWIPEIKKRGFGFRLGSGARHDESYLSQMFHLGDRRITSIMVRSSMEQDFYHFGATPKGTVDKWTEMLAEKDLSFDFFFQEKPEDWVFSWDFVDNLTKKIALWGEYIRSRQGMGHLEPCINECYQCGACDPQTWRQRKGWAKVKLADSKAVDPDKIQVIRQRGMVQRARLRVQIDDEHRYVAKDHWRLQFRRACYKTKVPIEKTIAFASDSIKMLNWISGVDYVDLKLTEHVFDRDLFISDEFNKWLTGVKVTDVRIYDDMKGISTIRDTCLYELPVPGVLKSEMQVNIDTFLDYTPYTKAQKRDIPNDQPGRDGKVPREIKRDFLKANPQCGRIKRMGFKGIERVIVDFRSLVDDIWIVDGSQGDLSLRIKARGEVTPYDIYQKLTRRKWKGGASQPAARLEFLTTIDDEQDDFTEVRCIETDAVIEKNLFGDQLHEDYCLRYQPSEDIYNYQTAATG